MSDEIEISGGGSTMVATDGMRAGLDQLRHLQHHLESCHREVAAMTVNGIAPRATSSLLDASHELHLASTRCRRLVTAVTTSIELYSEANHAVLTAVRSASSVAAWEVGFMLYSNPSLAGGLLVAGLGILGLGMSTGLLGFALGLVRSFAREHPALLNNHVLPEIISEIEMNCDDFWDGLHGRPYGSAARKAQSMKGGPDDGYGHPSELALSASAIATALAQLGMLRETGIRVERVRHTLAIRPVDSVASLFAGIPVASAQIGNARVRIDRYVMPDGSLHWVVYVAGTIDFNPVPGTEPFDMTSNIHGVGHGISPGHPEGTPEQTAASTRAVLEMMHEAGISPTDPVMIVGHSQGGTAATEVAARGEFNVRAVASFGSPVGQMIVPGDIKHFIVKNMEDPVAAMGGPDRDPAAIIYRRDMTAAHALHPGSAFASHTGDAYPSFARKLDHQHSELGRELHDFVHDFTAGATAGESEYWRAERVPAASDPALQGAAK